MEEEEEQKEGEEAKPEVISMGFWIVEFAFILLFFRY